MVATAAKNYWSNTWGDVHSLEIPALAFISTQLIGGLPLLPYALLHWHSDDFFRYVCFLTVALCASVLKVQLPGIKATMSANFLFILVGIIDLSYSETLLMGCLCGLVQTFWQAKPRPRPIQWLFSLANLALSVSAAELVFHSKVAAGVGFRWPLLMAAAATTYFAFNTISVSGIIAMTEKLNPVHVWKECYLWAFPYYLLGALIACGVIPLLFARCADCLWGERHQSAGRLAIRFSCLPHRLLDIPLLSDLLEPPRGAKEARRGNCCASLAHHRGTFPCD